MKHDMENLDPLGAAGFDVKYAMDNLNRLVDADEGTLSTGSITSRTRREKWDGGGLSPTGNWLRHKLDLDGNGSYAGTGEMDDTGTFNKANEWLTRDLDSTPGTTGDNSTLTHDDVGNMTNDGKNYKYKYDAFGRLMQIRNQSNNLVVEYMYDGLGQRTGWHADWDADGTVESSNDDPWYFFVYDDRWRIVGTYRVTSATITSGTVDTYDKPKEQFVYHHAGTDGRGGSSYIDSVILRDRDANNAWTAAGDTTLEERLFYAQNWRADVSLILNTNGRPLEKVKYSAYGVALPWTDLDYNNDGILSPDDSDDFITTPYDWDLDGDTDATDSTNFVADYGSYTTTKGVRGEVSLTTIANRKGYAGYEFDGATKQYHVRHRVYVPELGRWTRRDPLGYVNGESLFEYGACNPTSGADPTGLAWANYQFVQHYFTGRGRTVDLGDVGLGAAYEAHSAITRRIAQAKSIARAAARSECLGLLDRLSCRCLWQQPSLSSTITGDENLFVTRSEFVRSLNPTSIDYWFVDWTFSIGGHTLNMTYRCNQVATCDHECPRLSASEWRIPGVGSRCAKCEWSCDIAFSMRDTFTDPTDFGEIPIWVRLAIFGPYVASFPVDFGIPYEIKYKFDRNIEGVEWRRKDHTGCNWRTTIRDLGGRTTVEH